jgi:cytochrome c oxidase subunit 1
MYYEGLAGMPRRYFDFTGWISFNQFAGLNLFISGVAMLAFAAQLVFLGNFFLSIFRGTSVTEKNPWGANTLEWTTPIRPGHGNWPGDVPEVFRGPYEYGKEGKEFVPQDRPEGGRDARRPEPDAAEQT